MKGGKHKQPLGYTIVEVMIVLAISGLMFVIAADFINGKQEHASFSTGVNEFATELQDTIDQVNNGQYSDTLFNCNAYPIDDGTSVSVNITSPISASEETQGTSSTCVYLGKLLYFYSKNNGLADQYENFSLAGSQYNQSGGHPSYITDSYPTPIISTNGKVDLTVNQEMPDSLQLTGPIQINGGANASTYAIGFAQQWSIFRNNDCSSGTTIAGCYYTSGPMPIELVYATGLSTTTSDDPPSNTSPENYAAPLITDHLASINTAAICVTDGTQYAEIDIGTNGNPQLTVQTNIVQQSQCH
jgi:prepilin-type N-terminal cleavage/methylation domain-containing protein